MDPIQLSLAYAFYPIIIAILLWWLLKGKHHRDGGKKELWFVFGFIAINMFYIFAPDPTWVYRIYTEGGDMTSITLFSTISAVFLAVSIIIFKRYRD